MRRLRDGCASRGSLGRSQAAAQPAANNKRVQIGAARGREARTVKRAKEATEACSPRPFSAHFCPSTALCASDSCSAVGSSVTAQAGGAGGDSAAAPAPAGGSDTASASAAAAVITSRAVGHIGRCRSRQAASKVAGSGLALAGGRSSPFDGQLVRRCQTAISSFRTLPGIPG